MTEPENCMAAYACPHCGQRECIKIFGAFQTLSIYLWDSGTEEIESQGTDWEQTAECHCTKCSFEGTVADFTINKEDDPT